MHPPLRAKASDVSGSRRSSGFPLMSRTSRSCSGSRTSSMSTLSSTVMPVFSPAPSPERRRSSYLSRVLGRLHHGTWSVSARCRAPRGGWALPAPGGRGRRRVVRAHERSVSRSVGDRRGGPPRQDRAAIDQFPVSLPDGPDGVRSRGAQWNPQGLRAAHRATATEPATVLRCSSQGWLGHLPVAVRARLNACGTRTNCGTSRLHRRRVCGVNVAVTASRCASDGMHDMCPLSAGQDRSSPPPSSGSRCGPGRCVCRSRPGW